MAIDGIYKIGIRSPLGTMEQTLTFKTEENVLTGNVAQGNNVIPLIDGRVSGDKFEFVSKLPTPLGKKRCPCTGKVEGDVISGKVMTPLGMARFTGTRV